MRKLVVALAAVAALGLSAAGAEAQSKKVLIGTEGAYPPFNYIDENGKLQGFDIEIAEALCAAAEFECEFVVQDWDGIIPGLIAKKYDAIIASMSITDERKQVVDFTDKYYNTPGKFVAPKAAGLEIPEDLAEANEMLKGMRVGVQRATIHENFLRGEFKSLEIVPYATQDEANLDLTNGRLDLVMADSVALLGGFLETDAGADYEFVGPDYNVPEYHGEGAGIAVRKGDDELREAFNKAIDKIRADGTYQKINEKFFDFDVYGS